MPSTAYNIGSSMLRDQRRPLAMPGMAPPPRPGTSMVGAGPNMPPMIPGTTPAARATQPNRVIDPTNPFTGPPNEWDPLRPDEPGYIPGEVDAQGGPEPSWAQPDSREPIIPPQTGGGFQTGLPPVMPTGGGGGASVGPGTSHPVTPIDGGGFNDIPDINAPYNPWQSGGGQYNPQPGGDLQPGEVFNPGRPGFLDGGLPNVPSGGGGSPVQGGGGGTTPTSGYNPPIIVQSPQGTGGGDQQQRSSSGSSYSYSQPVHTFDPTEAAGFVENIGRENLDPLKFNDLFNREDTGGLLFSDLVGRENAPDQQYGKQQALEAANEANALLAQGLTRRQQDIAGSLGGRGMGEGGGAARLGDIATSETLGQQASNIRQALENAAKYGDQRSLDIFEKMIGQRGQDISQRGQLNQAGLELGAQGIAQRGQDVGMANAINQGGLELNQQGIQQRGQDLQRQEIIAGILKSLLGQDQRESWQNESSSGGPVSGGGGGGSGYRFNDMLFNMFGGWL